MPTNYWDIVIPASTTNLVVEPSMELSPSLWEGQGGSSLIEQTLTDQVFGTYSMSCSAGSAHANGGIRCDVAVTASTTYTFSAYVKASSGIDYKFRISDTGNNDIEMLTWAGRGVAMGQALDEVIAVADDVTGSIDDDGVVDVLRPYL